MAGKTLFKADGKQLLAVIAMISAVFVFASGEILIGCVLFAISAVLSIGGLFWNAHAQDRLEAAARKNAALESPTRKD